MGVSGHLAPRDPIPTYGLSCFYYRVRILSLSVRPSWGHTATGIRHYTVVFPPPAPSPPAEAVLDLVFHFLRETFCSSTRTAVRTGRHSVCGFCDCRMGPKMFNATDFTTASVPPWTLIVSKRDSLPAEAGDTHDRRAASNLQARAMLPPQTRRQSEAQAERNARSEDRQRQKETTHSFQSGTVGRAGTSHGYITAESRLRHDRLSNALTTRLLGTAQLGVGVCPPPP